MKTFIISSILWIACVGFANSNTNPIKEYLAIVNKAELAIMNKDYIMAIQLYDKAFKKYARPYSRDIENAIQCALLSKNNTKIYEYAKALIAIGCDLNFFDKQQDFIAFKHSKEWLKLIKEYSALRTQFSKKCNWKLRHQLEALIARDQYWRNKDPNYQVLKDSTFKEDDLIMRELLAIFENGYPSEYKVGVFIKEDTLINSELILPLILLHNYTSDTNYKKGVNLTKQLTNFANDGSLHPDIFSYLHDRAGKYKIGNGFAREGIIWKIKGNLYFEKLSKEVVEDINVRRLSLGLCSVEEMRKKAVYQDQHNGLFDFFENAYFNSIDMPQAIIDSFFILVEE